MAIKKTWQGRVVSKIVADYLKQITDVDGDAPDEEDRDLVAACRLMGLNPDDVNSLKREIRKEAKRQAKCADLPYRWLDVRKSLES